MLTELANFSASGFAVDTAALGDKLERIKALVQRFSGAKKSLTDVQRFRIRLDLNASTDAMEVNALDDVRVIALPRSRFARWSGAALCALVIFSWWTGDFSPRDLFSERRMARRRALQREKRLRGRSR